MAPVNTKQAACGILVSLFVGLAVFPSPAAAEPPRESAPAPAPDATTRSVEWLRANGQDPAEFVCGLFEQADVVLIGETHEIADNCAFISSLIEKLYHTAGVRVLATEFVRSSLDDRLDAVVTGDAWDDAAAIALFQEGPWPNWGYRDYVDILKAAWALNRSLADGAEPFRVIGIDDDWRQAELMAAEDPMTRFTIIKQREEHMFEAVAAGTLESGHKAAVHVGFAHSVFVGSERLGTKLRAKYAQRIAHVVLHHEIASKDGRSPVTTEIDAIFGALGGTPVAFRMPGSPIDELRDPDAFYTRMLGPDATLGSFIEHYAILKKIDDLRAVTWIPGFIKDDRLGEAIEVGEQLGWLEAGTVTTEAEVNAAFDARLRARADRP